MCFMERQVEQITLPDPPRLTRELGFLVTDASDDLIRFAARITGRKVARYIRETIESDARRVVAEFRQKQSSAA